MKILLMIPVKNEEKTLEDVIKQSATEIKKNINCQLEIVVVNDHSTDNSVLIAKKNSSLVIENNQGGLGNSFQLGLKYALENNFDVMITIDGDSQFSPSDLNKILNPIITEEADFVTGSRFLKDSNLQNIPKIKLWGNKLMSLLISGFLNQKYTDVSCGLRAYNREALLNLNLFGEFTYTQETFLNLSFKNLKIKEVPITVNYFSDRKSRIARSLTKYTWNTLKIIVKAIIYYKPTKLFGRLSLLLAIISFPILTILGIRYLITGLITPYKGFALLSLMLLILSFISLTAGLFLQSLSKIQLTTEKILYYERKKMHN